MTFWAPMSPRSPLTAGFCRLLGPPDPQGQGWTVPREFLAPTHLCLPPQVAVLSVTERTVSSVPATPKDSALLWGSPAAQGSPGDGDLQGKGPAGYIPPCDSLGGENAPSDPQGTGLPSFPVAMTGSPWGLLNAGGWEANSPSSGRGTWDLPSQVQQGC